MVRLVGALGQGYVQQGLGAADLFATLFFSTLRLRAADPRWPDRDRFLLSTAHNSALFHAALARRGLIDPARLDSYVQDGSTLEVNVSQRLGPLVEATLGSLGQGPSVGLGMALALRRRGSPARVYVVLGDGELQEGQVWEAAMYAGAHGIASLCVVIDLNFMQVEGHTDQVLRHEPLLDKWRAFGWQALAVDGHDIPALQRALAQADATRDRPTVIAATTLVGKGVGFLEGQLGHNMKLSPEDTRRALAVLDAAEVAA
ncbi:transketolase, N-terminal section [Piscinibacter sakaiensis]|uniref:Transketolase, N-terminal section n=1 Tax=Piscinibacter sakaiensis TaxID=1547922 RepID=A0A0K8P495_PISS1|nr:transketolase, N-terminal section [Piscinibacter sakaiensis]